MSSHVVSQQINVAGLPVSVWNAKQTNARLPVFVLFFLHGRMGSAEGLSPAIETVIEQVYSEANPHFHHDLFIVAFDHRNHGRRLVDERANFSWSKAMGDDKFNPRHAVDMYAIQAGTCSDVSFLMDFLPAYLFPSAERIIDDWGIAGISLGGHVAWMALSRDSRLSVGVPIIGCPDFLKLMSRRAKAENIPFEPPYIPSSFLNLLRQDPVTCKPYDALDMANPFLSKRILVLSGQEDKLVPWEASEDFVGRLEVGTGIKRVVLEAGTGHKCTSEMLSELAKFLRKEILSVTYLVGSL